MNLFINHGFRHIVLSLVLDAAIALYGKDVVLLVVTLLPLCGSTRSLVRDTV
jgi:hypothetical protein